MGGEGSFNLSVFREINEAQSKEIRGAYFGPKYSNNGKNNYIDPDGGTAESARGSFLCDQRRTGGYRILKV